MAKKKEEAVLDTAYKHEILAKSNMFIGTKYKASVLENKITYLAMLKIQKKEYEEDEGVVVSMSAGEIKKAVGSTSGSFYETLKSVADDMTGNNMGFVDDENESFEFITLINRAKYKDGVFEVRFASDLKDKLINIQSDFTKIPKQIAMSMKKPYSFPLYQLLKSSCYYPPYYTGIKNNKFKLPIGLAELKLDLGVVNANSSVVKTILKRGKGTEADFEKAVAAAEGSKEAMFKRWGDFDEKCLKPTVKEINECSDIYVEYEKISKGKGGKVHGVEFTVWLNGAEKMNVDTTAVVLDEDGEIRGSLSDSEKFQVMMDTMNLFKEYNVSYDEMLNICEAANYSYMDIEKAYNLLKKQSQTISNVIGWVISCIKNNYEIKSAEPEKKEKIKKNTFNNFDQRDYDYEELENLLLNSDPE